MRIHPALLFAAAACLSSGAAAQFIPPSVLEPVPQHPSSHERIGIRLLDLGAQRSLPPGSVFVARLGVSNGIIDVDLLATDTPAIYPDFHVVGDVHLDVLGWVGPLSPGTYGLRGRQLVTFEGAQLVEPLEADSVVVGDTAAPVTLVENVEYYNAVRDRYFMTPDPGEIFWLDAGGEPGWVRTGRTFNLYPFGGSDGRGSEMCRLVSPPVSGLDAHFYSASSSECGDLYGSPVWAFERFIYQAGLPDTLTGECPQGSQPVYRLWNPRSGDHRWVVDAALRVSMIGQGWISEGYGAVGVAMCAPLP